MFCGIILLIIFTEGNKFMNPNQDLIGNLVSNFGNLLDTSGFWNWFYSFSGQSPLEMSWDIFFGGGWVIFLIVFAWTLYFEVFLDYRAGQFQAKWKHVLLAIDIPKNNEQTPKAVENLFAALAGVFAGSNLIEKYWSGKVIESFSFELVSIEGHTRFLLRTPTHFRDFVESIIYSQYPEVEISEVSDYVDYESEYVDPKTGQPVSFRKMNFPNPMYNLWGVELVLAKPYPYPIKTYPEFEHQQTQQLIDPMGNILEILAKIGAGEQVWLQLVVQPRAPGWGEEAKKIVYKIQGKDYKPPESFDPSTFISKPLEGGASWLGGFFSHVTGIDVVAGGEEIKKEEDQWKMFKISPGERDVLIKVEKKIAKQAFKVRFRMIYLGKKEVFAKGRGVTGVIGSLQQFNTSDANAFKPGSYTKTAADYFFVDSRIAKKQNRILRWYCNRSSWYGESNQESKLTLLNPEELATIWHFPVLTVKASKVDKTESKKAAPPTRLPYMQRVAPHHKEDKHVDRPVSRIEPLQPGLVSPASHPSVPEFSNILSDSMIDDYEVDSVMPITPPILGTSAEVDVNTNDQVDQSSETVRPSQPSTEPIFPPQSAPSTQPANSLNKKGAPPSNLPFV